MTVKRMIVGAVSALLLCVSANAQVLPGPAMKNTLWTGFGNPFDGDTMYYGVTDVFQARYDAGKFTMEGMLSTGILANYQNGGDIDNFQIGTTNLNALALHYGRNSRYGDGEYSGGKAYSTPQGGCWNAVNSSNTLVDSYYVNFFYHINRNFDFGMGTKLNWSAGPSPRYGDWLWGADAHVRQGGFSTAYDDRSGSFARTSSDENTNTTYKFTPDRPGTADVVGFVHYASTYAKRAIGLRYVMSGDFDLEIGTAIPNGFNTDDPAMNFGVKVSPVDWISVGAALEGAFEDGANFYTGATIGAKNFILEVYLAVDSLFTSADDDQSYGTGAAVSFTIPRTSITLRPEIGLNLFENDDYTPAWYTGASLILPISKEFQFSVYGSAAFGSKDERWDDSSETDDWDGGHVLTARPSVKYKFSKHMTIDAYVNLENRRAFDDKTRNAWSSGVYVTYIF